MSGHYPLWFPAVAAAVMIVFLGMRVRLLARPDLKVRCGACGRLVWRGRTCSCTRVKAD